MATQRENSLFLFFLCIIYYIIDTDTRNLDRLVARAHNGKDNDSKEKIKIKRARNLCPTSSPSERNRHRKKKLAAV